MNTTINTIDTAKVLTDYIWEAYLEGGVVAVDTYMKENKLPWSILQTRGEDIVAAANTRGIDLTKFLKEWEAMIQEKWDKNETFYAFTSHKDDPNFVPIDSEEK
jgi:hypothetical protein